jgi:S-adenosylmethionine synthetase
MFEKVNPSHPDKVADRIAGAIVDLCYKKNDSPKVAVEVLLGHGLCTVIAETSEVITEQEVCDIVHRIAGAQEVKFICVKQDIHLAQNQRKSPRCGDNGIFKGSPVSAEQAELSSLAHQLYQKYPTDGKFIVHGNRLTICQSQAKNRDLRKFFEEKGYKELTINPLGEWEGGPNVDSGATNRKLGSDMGDGVTGGGLHGKDLSKADVSVNIFCHIMAQKTNRDYKAVCAIGDEYVNGIPYTQIVSLAKNYIDQLGGFEKFAEWGLI